MKRTDIINIVVFIICFISIFIILEIINSYPERSLAVSIIFSTLTVDIYKFFKKEKVFLPIPLLITELDTKNIYKKFIGLSYIFTLYAVVSYIILDVIGVFDFNF